MNDIQKLHYWTFKILPLAYDDSLSYYEVLAKVTSKLNEVIENVNDIPDAIKEQLDSDTLANKIMQNLAKAIATDEGEATFTATAKDGGELIWLNGVLYEVVAPMAVGTNYVVGSNINEVVLEDILNHMKGYLSDKNEFYAERSTHDYDTGVYLYWKDNLYITTADIKINDILYDDGDSQNLKEVTLGEEVASHYLEMHNADNNLQTQIDGNDGDIEKLQAEDVNLQNQITNNNTNVNNRISNIVAQAGTDNSEIVDARVDYYGETQTSLHDAMVQDSHRALGPYKKTVLNSGTADTFNITDADNAPSNTFILIHNYSIDNLPTEVDLSANIAYLVTLSEYYTISDPAPSLAGIQFFLTVGDSQNYRLNVYSRTKYLGNWGVWHSVSLPILPNTTSAPSTPEEGIRYYQLSEGDEDGFTNFMRIGLPPTRNVQTALSYLLIDYDSYGHNRLRITRAGYSAIYYANAFTPAGALINDTYTNNATPYQFDFTYDTDLDDMHGNFALYMTAATTNPNKPSSDSGVLLCFSPEWDNMAGRYVSKNSTTQIFITHNTATTEINHIYVRYGNTYNKFTNWTDILAGNVSNNIGTFRNPFQIFKTFITVGDSLTAGYTNIGSSSISSMSALEQKNNWPSYIAEKLGTTNINVARGSTRTHDWRYGSTSLNVSADCELANQEADTVIVALGANDARNSFTVGTSDDIATDYADNADTFYGNYDYIVNKLYEQGQNLNKPRYVWCFTLPPHDSNAETYNTAIRYVANKYSWCKLIDLYNLYYQQYTTAPLTTLYIGGHYNPLGYNIISGYILKALNEYMYNNPDEFKYEPYALS